MSTSNGTSVPPSFPVTATPSVSPDVSTPEDHVFWAEQRYAAAAPFLDAFVEHGGPDAPLEVRTRTVDVAVRRARKSDADYPTDRPGKVARELLAALAEVEARRPRAKAEPAGIPQAQLMSLAVAGAIAADPSMVDRLPAGIVSTFDHALGRSRPLAAYYDAVVSARQQLAAACDRRVSDATPAARRAAGVETLAQRQQRERSELAAGPGVF